MANVWAWTPWRHNGERNEQLVTCRPLTKGLAAVARWQGYFYSILLLMMYTLPGPMYYTIVDRVLLYEAMQDVSRQQYVSKVRRSCHQCHDRLLESVPRRESVSWDVSDTNSTETLLRLFCARHGSHLLREALQDPCCIQHYVDTYSCSHQGKETYPRALNRAVCSLFKRPEPWGPNEPRN